MSNHRMGRTRPTTAPTQLQTAIDNWQPAQPKPDSQVAAEASGKAMLEGRYELGLAFARIALEAHRIEQAGTQAVAVPMAGATRDEHARTIDRTPYAAGPTGDGDADLAAAQYESDYQEWAAKVNAGDETAVQQAIDDTPDPGVADLAQTGIFGMPPEQRLEVPPTQRCRAQVKRDGAVGECHEVVIYGQQEANTAPAWYHLHQGNVDHLPLV
jgi:hypothetical protein